MCDLIGRQAAGWAAPRQRHDPEPPGTADSCVFANGSSVFCLFSASTLPVQPRYSDCLFSTTAVVVTPSIYYFVCLWGILAGLSNKQVKKASALGGGCRGQAMQSFSSYDWGTGASSHRRCGGLWCDHVCCLQLCDIEEQWYKKSHTMTEDELYWSLKGKWMISAAKWVNAGDHQVQKYSTMSSFIQWSLLLLEPRPLSLLSDELL